MSPTKIWTRYQYLISPVFICPMSMPIFKTLPFTCTTRKLQGRRQNFLTKPRTWQLKLHASSWHAIGCQFLNTIFYFVQTIFFFFASSFSVFRCEQIFDIHEKGTPSVLLDTLCVISLTAIRFVYIANFHCILHHGEHALFYAILNGIQLYPKPPPMTAVTVLVMDGLWIIMNL